VNWLKTLKLKKAVIWDLQIAKVICHVTLLVELVKTETINKQKLSMIYFLFIRDGFP
jgi:hypothetical protein